MRSAPNTLVHRFHERDRLDPYSRDAHWRPAGARLHGTGGLYLPQPGYRVASVNDALAHERLVDVLELIDRWGELYNRRWGKRGHVEEPGLASQVDALIDDVRKRTKLAHDVIVAMGEEDLAAKVVEHEEGMYGGHPFTQARVAIVEAIAILAQREELAEIVGPVGPRLVASELHPTIWGAAAKLWDDGHLRPAVQTAATALEGAFAGHSRTCCIGRESRHLVLDERSHTRITPPAAPRC